MQWILKNNELNSTLIFNDSEVHMFVELSKKLPLIGSIDPYKDAIINADYVSFYLDEMEVFLFSYTSSAFKNYSKQTRLSENKLLGDFALLSNAFKVLNKDTFYLLLKKCLDLLKEAKKHNSAIEVYGN